MQNSLLGGGKKEWLWWMKDLGCRDFEMRTLPKKGEMDTSNLPFENTVFPLHCPEFFKVFG